MTSYWDVYSETLPHCYPESKADDRWLRRLATGDVFPDALRQLRWTIDSATVADVPLAIVSSRIVSDRVKVLLESNLGPKDNVRWAPSTVVTKDGVEHPYWTPLFFPALDPTTILHPAHTTWGPGGPIRWVLKESAMEGHHVTVVKPIGRELIITESIRGQLDAASVTGAQYRPARIAP